MTSNNIAAVVPCAGLGTRMKSSKPKFLHEICGRTIISHIVFSLIDVCDEIVLVVGNGSKEVIAEINNIFSSHKSFSKIVFAEQKELLGSGDAVRVGLEKVSSKIDSVLVLPGDVPLMTSEIISPIIDKFIKQDVAILISVAKLENSFGYGRIVRDNNLQVQKIVEEKDCDEYQRNISEANMCPFIFKKDFLLSALPKINSNNSQNEIYLTDTVEIAAQAGERITVFKFDDCTCAYGVNDRKQLGALQKIMQARINEMHMSNGVTIIDPDNTYIDCDVKIENDVTITPGSVIRGNSKIKAGSIIDSSTLVDALVGANVSIGPKSYLRPGTVLHDNVHIGTSVEIKKSEIGKGTKIPHLSYIGDCITGENCNFGGGTITANYDGKDKHQTILGDNVKLGVNTILVAPVKIGNNVYSAAGAVITKDVPDSALAKGVPAEIIENWTPPSERT